MKSRIGRIAARWVACCLAAVAVTGPARADLIIPVVIDTTANGLNLGRFSPGFIDIVFNGQSGALGTSANATATITAFKLQGDLDPPLGGGIFTAGTVTGNLNSTLQFTATQNNPPDNEYSEGLLLGDVYTFTVDISQQAGGTAPNTFSVDLQDGNGNSIGNDGNSPLLILNINPDGSYTEFDNGSPAGAVDVPEPSSLLLCGGAALAGAYRCWRRRKTPSDVPARSGSPASR